MGRTRICYVRAALGRERGSFEQTRAVGAAGGVEDRDGMFEDGDERSLRGGAETLEATLARRPRDAAHQEAHHRAARWHNLGSDACGSQYSGVLK